MMDALSNLDQKTFQQKISFLKIATREMKHTHAILKDKRTIGQAVQLAINR